MQWVTDQVTYCRDGIVTSGSGGHSWNIRNIRALRTVVIFGGWVIIRFKQFLMLPMDVESKCSGQISKLLDKLVTE